MPGRAPDRSVLAEERLANVTEEMAIAAGLPAPRVVIVPGGVNAAACGRDQAHVTLIVGEALPASLPREQLEGMVAHLVGSIADGDMAIGLRVTTTLALFGLVAKAGGAFNDRREFRETMKLWRVFVAPTSAGTIALLGALADPFKDAAGRRPSRPASNGGGLTWREWLLMPLMGPVLITGFLRSMRHRLPPLAARVAGVAPAEVHGGRDGRALTRDPDALAGALAAIADSPLGVQPWTAHLAVAADPQAAEGRSASRWCRSSRRSRSAWPRWRRWARMSRPPRASACRGRRRSSSPALRADRRALMSVVVYLLVIVSAALSGLFTIVPAALLHVLLRAFGRS